MVIHLLQPERHRALIHADGDISVAEAERAVRALAADPDLRRDMHLLVDAQRWDGNWFAQQVQSLIPAFRELRRQGVARSAFVVGCDVAYGMCRMFTAYLEPLGLAGEVFRSMDDAERWLAGPA